MWNLQIIENIYGAIQNLGNLYNNQGKIQEAEAMYRSALEGSEKAWGPEHTSALNAVNSLGNLYADQAKLQEAEAMYRRALDGYEKAWVPRALVDARYSQ